MLDRVAKEYKTLRDAFVNADLTYAERLAILGTLRYEYERHLMEEIDSVK